MRRGLVEGVELLVRCCQSAFGPTRAILPLRFGVCGSGVLGGDEAVGHTELCANNGRCLRDAGAMEINGRRNLQDEGRRGDFLETWKAEPWMVGVPFLCTLELGWSARVSHNFSQSETHMALPP